MVVLVTGSSKGIGYQIASDLLDQGHDLALHCNRNKSSLEGLLSAYKSNSVIIQADLSSYNDIKKLVDETTNKLQSFVYAGIAPDGGFSYLGQLRWTPA